MAQSGKRVILVDTDLRRPSLHKLFGLPNSAGFTSLVVGHLSEAEKTAILQRIPEVPNLRVITSGPLPPNPSELLNSGEAAKVMQQISQAGDVIIYDTPPVTAVTDPAILATRVDAVVYVINAGVTRRFMVERVLRILETVGVKTVLPVLNRVKLQDVSGYYYYSGKNYGTTGEPELSTNGHHANGRTAEVASVDGVRLDAGQDD
jgi:capsular exopolysaccharide synthesis family protein